MKIVFIMVLSLTSILARASSKEEVEAVACEMIAGYSESTSPKSSDWRECFRKVHDSVPECKAAEYTDNKIVFKGPMKKVSTYRKGSFRPVSTRPRENCRYTSDKTAYTTEDKLNFSLTCLLTSEYEWYCGFDATTNHFRTSAITKALQKYLEKHL